MDLLYGGFSVRRERSVLVQHMIHPCQTRVNLQGVPSVSVFGRKDLVALLQLLNRRKELRHLRHLLFRLGVLLHVLPQHIQPVGEVPVKGRQLAAQVSLVNIAELARITRCGFLTK